MPLDHPLDVGQLVPGNDAEMRRVAAQVLVLVHRHLDDARALDVPALAHEVDGIDAPTVAFDREDALVHLPEQDLVLGDALFPVHAPRFLPQAGVGY